ncbi:MAG: Fic family protein [Cyclobacteriaceae bacterium]
MNPLLLKANELKKQYQFRSPKAWTAEEKESILNDFTFHNNKLEGLKLEYGDTIDFLKKGIIRKNSDIKDITDLRNHKSLLKKIFESYDDLTLSTQMIKDLHAELMKDKIQWDRIDVYLGGPGKFKQENNFGIRKKGEYKEYMDWTKVPLALDKLCDETNQRLENPDDVIPTVNNFHYEFANEIHPFGDGNGRMVRLIHNLLLLKHGFPLIIIQADEKNVYLESIIEQEKRPDIRPFDEFLTKKLIVELEKRIKNPEG